METHRGADDEVLEEGIVEVERELRKDFNAPLLEEHFPLDGFDAIRELLSFALLLALLRLFAFGSGFRVAGRRRLTRLSLLLSERSARWDQPRRERDREKSADVVSRCSHFLLVPRR